MNDSPQPTNDVLAASVRWIEQRLQEPLTLDWIASEAGLSAYHFSRLFTARMGRSVMAHVRGRRLVRSAQRLIDDPELKLVDAAFDSGFESQEAFTRAFKRVFGVAPARFRRGFSITPIEGQYPMTMPADSDAKVTRQPELVSLEAFTVAGFSRRFDATTKSEIPQLWSKLVGGLPFEGQSNSWNTYGVVWSADRHEGSFQYMAGVELFAGAEPPSGFEQKRIPAATYLVFRIHLNGGPLHPQVKAAMALIWGELIPASGLKLGDSPDFELYNGEFAPTRPDAFIDFYVPIDV